MREQTLMIVDPGLRLWGSERALAATLKSLTNDWDRVVLVTPPGAELAEEVYAHPALYGHIKIFSAPIGMLHTRSRAERLVAVMALTLIALRLRPARMYLNQAGLANVLRPVCRILSIPLVVHLRILEDIPRVIPLQSTQRSPLTLIFVSDAMAAKAEPARPPEGTSWIKAYDPYSLAPEPEKLPVEAPFVFVGRLSRGKGPHLLLDALAQRALATERADFYGTGVHGDAYAAALNVRVKALDGRARMMGFRGDVIQRLPAYRFLVSASEYEPLGRVVMEGWEAGLVPIVFAGSGGAAEMVQKSDAGLSFADWTAEALADCLLSALHMTPEEHRAMVTRGRDWMAQNLDLDSYRRALSGVLFRPALTEQFS